MGFAAPEGPRGSALCRSPPGLGLAPEESPSWASGSPRWNRLWTVGQRGPARTCLTDSLRNPAGFLKTSGATSCPRHLWEVTSWFSRRNTAFGFLSRCLGSRNNDRGPRRWWRQLTKWGAGGPSHAGAYPPCPPKLLAPHTPPRSSLPASPAIIRGPVHTLRRLQPPLQAPRLTRASPKRGEEDVTQKPVRMHVAFGVGGPRCESVTGAPHSTLPSSPCLYA